MKWSILLGLAIASFGGCASWHVGESARDEVAASTNKPVLNSPVAPDTVTIQTALVRYDEDHLSDLQQAWASADETILEFEQRRLLDANGIRVGVIRGELPKQLTQQIELSQKRQKTDIVEQLGLGADAEVHSLTWVCRAGSRKELVVRREMTKPLSVFTILNGSVAGYQYEKAMSVLGMTVYPQADGKSLIELVPEIQHGEPRNSYVAGEFGMRQETKRDAKVWKQFKIRTALNGGELLMVSATSPAKALGHAFFTTETNRQTEEQLVVLIRLTTKQQDPVFGENIMNQARTMMESY
ncbi:MAG: hypothetical protein U0930_16800 [Pirellulales bacterium]